MELKIRFKIILLSVIGGIVVNFIVYFGFTTNYTQQVFSKSSFEEQYDKSVFKYRILSKHLLLQIEDLVQEYYGQRKVPDRIKLLDENASSTFYISYFILNTIAFCFFLITFLEILVFSGKVALSESEKTLIYFIILLVTGLSQYVITPYDLVGYFLQGLTLCFFLKSSNLNQLSIMIICGLLISLSTLNRESSAVTLAFIATVLLYNYGPTKIVIRNVILLSAFFMIAYFGLRIWIDPQKVTLAGRNLFWFNISEFKNLIGVLFCLLLFYLSISISKTKSNQFLIGYFHLICLPYILTCFVSGILFEVRLYLPIFFGSLILSRFSLYNNQNIIDY